MAGESEEETSSSAVRFIQSSSSLSPTSISLKIFCSLIFIPQFICCGVPKKSLEPTRPPYNTNSLALLSGTLRTYHGVSCGEEWMRIRCPTGTTISVQLAQFGRNSRLPRQCFASSHTTDLLNGPDPASNNVTCIMPTAIQYSLLQTVVGFCQKKTSCKFQTSPSTFGGDPCPGLRKYVEVDFKCRPSEFKSVIGCEDEVIQLKCNRSSRLAIYSANYGRTEYESVQCPQPSGVPEESCLSSFATETVMQMCHGKRKCALSADPATFGSPCKPETRMYLKVIHTCVPRKVLQEKYQGELDPDEIFEAEEGEDDGMDSSVIEQPSIYSPDHSKGWPHSKNSTKHGRNSLSQSSEDEGTKRTKDDLDAAVGDEEEQRQLSSAIMSQDSHNGSFSPVEDEYRGSMAGVQIVYLITQGISAYDFISKNPQKFYFYLAISTAVVLFVLVLVILVKVTVTRRRSGVQLSSSGSTGAGGKQTGLSSSAVGASSSAGPILSSGLSDIDELSLDMEPNDIAFTELPSILKRSSPFDREHGDVRRDIRPLSTVTGGGAGGGGAGATVPGMATTTLGRSNEVVRFSNTLGRRDRDTNNPRSLRQQASSEDNERFLYG